MPRSLTAYKVFIASPGGLDDERQAFRNVIHEFNQAAALPEGIYFEPIGWEMTLGGLGRAQSLINEELRKCDFFTLMLCDRWGSPPGGESAYTSGTEEEYEVAMECHRAGTMLQAVILFKSVDLRQLNDPGDKLKKVLAFKEKLEQEYSHLYKNFDSIRQLEEHLRLHLHQWLRQVRIDNNDKPMQYLIGDSEARLLAAINESVVINNSAEQLDRVLAEAWKIANEGKSTEAEMTFARAIINYQHPDALISYGRFLVRLGLIDRAKGMYEDALVLSEKLQFQSGIADAYYGNGNILEINGDLSGAEKMYYLGLEVDEKALRQKGLAKAYGNIGNILNAREAATEAEAMFEKSLSLCKESDYLEGLATVYTSLGIIRGIRQDVDGAEIMYRNALEIGERLNDYYIISNSYGNLGILFKSRNDLNIAEEMYNKCLEIKLRLGHQEGIATSYLNLGVIFKERGDYVKAEEMYRKGIDITDKIGNMPKSYRSYYNLASLLSEQGNASEAKKYYLQALNGAKLFGITSMINRIEVRISSLD